MSNNIAVWVLYGIISQQPNKIHILEPLVFLNAESCIKALNKNQLRLQQGTLDPELRCHKVKVIKK